MLKKRPEKNENIEELLKEEDDEWSEKRSVGRPTAVEDQIKRKHQPTIDKITTFHDAHEHIGYTMARILSNYYKDQKITV